MRVIQLHAPLTHLSDHPNPTVPKPSQALSIYTNTHPIIPYPHTVSPNTAILSHHITGMTNTRAYTQKKFGPCIIFKL